MWELVPRILQWRHNEHDGVSNHRRLYCLLNRLFRRRSKRISKLRVTGLCEENSPVTGEFPAQRTSNAENVSIWWRHNVKGRSCEMVSLSWRYHVYSDCGTCLNISRSEQNGCQFGDDIFLNENYCSLLKISLKFVLMGRIYHESVSVQVMVWCQRDSKPLHELLSAMFCDAT